MEKKIKSTKKTHKLTIADIKQNPNIETEHIINKIKRHERLYTFYLVIFFFLTLSGVTLLIATSLKDQLPFNSYTNGDLLVEYQSNNNLIGNIITLTDKDIIEDVKVKDNNDYIFTITNDSNCSMKYHIVMRDDDDFIELDECGNKQFSKESIRYNINHGSIFSLHNKIDDTYQLVEDVIPAHSTKVYYLNFWIDKNVLLQDRHYHGIIEVNTVK